MTILNGRSAHCLGSPWAWPPVRAAQHAAGNLDNRHVAIVCAASTRVNVSAFLPTVDSANCPWPTWRRSAAGLFAVGQRVARSFPERWPADLLRGHEDYGSRPSTRAQGGAAWSLPLLIGGGNGRQVARPRFALLPVAVLRSLRLGGGSRHFWLGVFCPRYSRNARRGLWAAGLKWTSYSSNARRLPACPASGARTTTTCCVRAKSLAAS